jgi:hypothetical protein
MYPDHYVFVITDRGLNALQNDELPSSVLTSILRLVDGSIALRVFSILLKGYGDIQPFFKQLHNDGLIVPLNDYDNDAEIKVAPASIKVSSIAENITASLPFADTEQYQVEIPFSADVVRKVVYDYLLLNNPRIIPAVMAMFNILTTKQDFIDHLEMYSRLIAEDKKNASGHIIAIKSLLD